MSMASAAVSRQGARVSRSVRAMSCDVTMVAFGERAATRLARAEHWLASYEQRFSRFLPTSELSRLNAAGGRPFAASPALFRLVSFALDLARRSDGIFDPTILRSLEAAGYDRSFELVPDDVRAGATPPAASWKSVDLDARRRTITLPPGSGIDLGGIGKGWAVDRIAAILGSPCLVNAGGDVSARGVPAEGDPWLVGVADPLSPERDLAVIRAVDRGVATSSTRRRSWHVADRVLHHLIDPRRGAPSDSDAIQVTAIAPSATLADFHAKVALLKGADAGLRYLEEEQAAEGIVVRADGTVFRTPGLG